MPPEPLLPGRDYTVEGGLYVFTADYLRRRGYCCENACRNCPYGFGRPVNAEEKASSSEQA
jgi:hypothetical protein